MNAWLTPHCCAREHINWELISPDFLRMRPGSVRVMLINPSVMCVAIKLAFRRMIVIYHWVWLVILLGVVSATHLVYSKTFKSAKGKYPYYIKYFFLIHKCVFVCFVSTVLKKTERPFVYSFIFTIYFSLVKVMVDPEPIPETLDGNSPIKIGE